VAFGATPLEAAVRPGHRIVELSLDGHLPVRELLELGQGDRLSRVFDLTSADAEVAEPAAVAAADERPSAGHRLTASELLTRAQEQRAARNVRGAAATYERLIQSYPGSAEAHASLVSLGTIQLDRLGKPGRALRLFDRYLARSRRGTLAQEAAYGRARALRALGRRQAEIDGLKQFLETYPGAVQAGLARQRLTEITPD
jgi:tetratricopeptide (TPR) repeat protein